MEESPRPSARVLNLYELPAVGLEHEALGRTLGDSCEIHRHARVRYPTEDVLLLVELPVTIRAVRGWRPILAVEPMFGMGDLALAVSTPWGG